MPPRRSTPKIFYRAKALRHEQTHAETRLWAYLRNHRLGGVGFRRQHAIGRYVADFCAPSIKLVVELDGIQHLDQAESDAQRTKFLESEGYKVLRFANNIVMDDIESVLCTILSAINPEHQN